MQSLAGAFGVSSQSVQTHGEGPRAARPRIMQAFYRTAYGCKNPEDDEIVGAVFLAWLRDGDAGPSLEERFGLKRTPNGRNLIARDLLLDAAIRQWQADKGDELDGPQAGRYGGLTRPEVESFARDWQAFVERGRWAGWRGLRAPPAEHAEPLDAAFFYLTVANGGEALTAKSLLGLLEKVVPEVSKSTA